jgi:hypothetical protein
MGAVLMVSRSTFALKRFEKRTSAAAAADFGKNLGKVEVAFHPRTGSQSEEKTTVQYKRQVQKLYNPTTDSK